MFETGKKLKKTAAAPRAKDLAATTTATTKET